MSTSLAIIPSSSRVLVTGGAGFIGSHLVEHLVALGGRVTVVDNLSTGELKNIQAVLPQIELVTGDLIDLLCAKKIRLNDYACIFHLAANPYIPPSIQDPVFDYRANLRGTFTLLETLRQSSSAPRLVNISSAAVYGNPLSLPIKETDPTIPISPYGVSKLAGERYVAVYSQIYGIRATSLRLFSVYGPRQRKQIVYDLFRKLRTDSRRVQLLGDGTQTRDFTYVLDVVQAMVLAATLAPGRGEVYNVASGTSYNIADLVSFCCKVCDLAPEITYTGNVRPGDAEKWVVDLTQLKQLGYSAKTSLEAGLTSVRDWYDATIK